MKRETYAYASNQWTKTEERRYVYDGWNLAQELDGTNTLVRSYVWGLDLSQTLQGAGGVGGLLASIEGTNVYHYFHDANGNVGQLVKSSDGTVAAHYEYDPFGNTTWKSGPLADANPFRFSTKYNDTVSGLYYYGYRYYAPTIGRWVNRDPMEEEGGTNLYEFVGNDSINQVDYFGLWSGMRHRMITANSWSRFLLPQGMDQYSSQILHDLMTSNEGTDSGNTRTINYWHFNRGLSESVASGISKYLHLLSSQEANFAKLLGSPSGASCKEAIKTIGMLSHAWQDYYAHAIDLKSDGSAATIGTIAGSPSFPSARIKPASFGWNLGEHGASEPGDRALDTSDRLIRSADYTGHRFKSLIDNWWNSCECFAGQVYP